MNIQLISDYIKNQSISLDIETGFTLKIHDNVFKPGTFRVHLPAPINAGWLKEGQLLDSEPMFRMASVEDFPQRSVYFNEILTENRPFSVKYAFSSVHRLVYPDIKLIDSTVQKSFTDEQVGRFTSSHHCGCESYTGLPADAVRIQDVCEEKGLPFTDEYYVFLSEIKSDPASEKRGTTAKSIYRFIVEKFNRMNRSDHNIAFVSMCRICGIPARWQGGLGMADENICAIPHDWAMVHLLPYGWIYADCSFGAEAFEKELTVSGLPLCDFFFGNIDPCMVPTASAPAADLYPAKDYERTDKMFNISGEVEMVPDKMNSEQHMEGYGLKADEYDTEIYLHIM